MPGAGNPLAWDRYAYALNSPVRYTDPTGHFSKDQIVSFFGVDNWSQVLVIFDMGALKDRWGWLTVLMRAEIGDTISITTGDTTITGVFALGPDGTLIIIFPDQNYYIDLVTAGLDGDSYTLTKEDNFLDDIFCSPMDCGLSEEESVFETEAVRGPIPYEYNRPKDLDLWPFNDDPRNIFTPPTDNEPIRFLPLGPGGGPVQLFHNFLIE